MSFQSAGQSMKTAIIVVDMVKDHFREGAGTEAIAGAGAIIPGINRLTALARRSGLPVVFSNDSFLPGDFVFRGRMKEQALRGTPGSEVIDELTRASGDFFVPKRRFSAFFKTDLDQTLRLHGVNRVAIAGINSHWCVLHTAFDALSQDLHTLIVSDCCASYRADVHETTMDLYRNNALFPLFRIVTLDECAAILAGEKHPGEEKLRR